MDEIIFRGSEKLENFQIQLSLIAQQGKILFQQYSERSITFAQNAWHSPKMVKLQEIAKELLEWCLEVANKGKHTLSNFIDYNYLINTIQNLLRNKMIQRQLLYGCICFIVGCFVGYSIASFLQNPVVLSAYMQAVVCTSYDGIDSTTLIDDMPAPRVEDPDDVLIQVKASSICSVDLAISGGYAKRLRYLLSKYNPGLKSEFPIILGRSCSGIVLEVGQDVSRFEIGDEVYLTSPVWAQGTISQLHVAKEFRIAHKPKRIGFEGAAGLPYAGSIALNAIRLAGITSNNAQDKRILICNSCTPTGCILVQYCQLLGAQVIATSDIKNAPVAQALGAEDVILIQNDEQHNQLKKELELRDLFDVIFVTKELQFSKEQFRKFCKPNGSVICTFLEYRPSDNFGLVLGSIFWSWTRTKCLVQNIFGLKRNFGEPEETHEYLEILTDLVDNQKLQSVVDKVFHPLDIESAVKHVQSLHSVGSCIITFR